MTAFYTGTFTYNIASPSVPGREMYWKHIYRLLQSTSTIGSISFTDLAGNRFIIRILHTTSAFTYLCLSFYSVGCRRVSPYELLANVSDTPYMYFASIANDPLLALYNYEVDPATIDVGL